jgi:antitoxin HigA-1
MHKIKNIHPGEVLLKEFLEPLKLSQSQLAKNIGVHARRINEVIHGKRGITANTALLLAKYFNIPPEFWMALQRDYELEEERHKMKKRLSKIEPLKRCG